MLLAFWLDKNWNRFGKGRRRPSHFLSSALYPFLGTSKTRSSTRRRTGEKKKGGNGEGGRIRSGSRWLREISLFSDITPVIVMPSNWTRFVHPRKTAGIFLNIRSWSLLSLERMRERCPMHRESFLLYHSSDREFFLWSVLIPCRGPTFPLFPGIFQYLSNNRNRWNCVVLASIKNYIVPSLSLSLLLIFQQIFDNDWFRWQIRNFSRINNSKKKIHFLLCVIKIVTVWFHGERMCN